MVPRGHTASVDAYLTPAIQRYLKGRKHMPQKIESVHAKHWLFFGIFFLRIGNNLNFKANIALYELSQLKKASAGSMINCFAFS